MQRARDSVGASGRRSKVTFTDKEWEAVQAGAISDNMLTKFLNSSDSDEIVKRANKILEHLQGEFDKIKSSDEVFREMISTELVNHEACITCDYEPALAALNMSIKDLTENQIKIMQEELHKQIEYYNA